MTKALKKSKQVRSCQFRDNAQSGGREEGEEIVQGEVKCRRKVGVGMFEIELTMQFIMVPTITNCMGPINSVHFERMM